MDNRKEFRVGIIGAGLQGGRRGPVIKQFPGQSVALVASPQREDADRLAATTGCPEATTDWREVVSRKDIDAVIICTPPHLHAEMSLAAMRNGQHVLCEKPLARTVAEAAEMLRVAGESGVVLKCGFNHRHHPAVQRAKELFDGGAIGELNFIRGRYGICGRPGYEKEWRADPAKVGGGQLMEQGIHAVDLFRWFLGDFTEVTGFTATRYWPVAPLEDNAFALFRTGQGQVASLHSSLTQWINLFSFEIYGQDGYLLIEGLGGGYGTEKLVVGRRDLLAPFKEEVTHFRGGDRSWYEEWREFMAAIETGRRPLGDGRDGLAAMQLVEAVYQSSRTGSVVKLP